MRGWSDLKEHYKNWSTDVSNQIKKLPSEADRIRLLIELEKVSLLCEIAQGIALYHERK